MPMHHNSGYRRMQNLKKLVREIPDFPKPGILFYDITPILKNPVGLHCAIDTLADPYANDKIDLVIGIEARGFIFAPAVAYRLNAGFIPVRKANKLPAATQKISYNLEYGNDVLEMHTDAIFKGQTVLIIDDLLATGGTAKAVCQLIEQAGGHIKGLGFLIELKFLKGREKLTGYPIYSILQYM